MRLFDFPAKYSTYIEAELSLMLANVGRDVQQRASGRTSTIPDQFIDESRDGRAVVMVMPPTSELRARIRKTARRTS